MRRTNGKVGKPLKFKTPQELEDKIKAYFDKCDKTGRPYTLTGLAIDLDTTRETLMDYGVKNGYSDSIRRAKVKIHNYAEESLWRGGGISTGIIFNLKNNWGWRDKNETAISGIDGGAINQKIQVEFITPNDENSDS